MNIFLLSIQTLNSTHAVSASASALGFSESLGSTMRMEVIRRSHPCHGQRPWEEEEDLEMAPFLFVFLNNQKKKIDLK